MSRSQRPSRSCPKPFHSVWLVDGGHDACILGKLIERAFGSERYRLNVDRAVGSIPCISGDGIGSCLEWTCGIVDQTSHTLLERADLPRIDVDGNGSTACHAD